MGLGLPTGGNGNFVPYLKFNAKAGRWYTREEGEDGKEFEVEKLTAVFDMADIRTGYLKFAAGEAPDFVFDSSAGVKDAVAPNDQYRRGFVVHVFSEKNLGGVREFASNAGVVNEALNLLFDAYDEAPEKAQGLAPVVKFSGVEPITGKHGTNYRPVFEISKWIEKPAAFDEATETVNGPASSAPVPAPQPAALEPADADDEY